MKDLPVPEQIARSILSVQPMDEAAKAFGELYQWLKDNPDKSLVLVPRKK